MRLPGCKVRSVVSQIRTIYGETSVPGDKWLSRVCQWDGDTDKDYYRAQGWRHRYNVGVMSIVWCEDTKIDRKQNQVQHSTRRHHSLLCGARLVSPGSSGSSQRNAEFSSLHSARDQAPGPVQAVSSQCSALADPVSWCLTISH